MASHDGPAQFFISERSHKPGEVDSAGHPATASTGRTQGGAPRSLRVQLVRAYQDELVQIRTKRGRRISLNTSHATALAKRAPGERNARSAAPVVARIVRQSGDNALVVRDAAARAAAKLSGPIRAAHGRGHRLQGRSTPFSNIIAFPTGSPATRAIAMAPGECGNSRDTEAAQSPLCSVGGIASSRSCSRTVWAEAGRVWQVVAASAMAARALLSAHSASWTKYESSSCDTPVEI